MNSVSSRPADLDTTPDTVELDDPKKKPKKPKNYTDKAKLAVKNGIGNIVIAKDSYFDYFYKSTDQLIDDLSKQLFSSQIYLGNAFYHEKRRTASLSALRKIEHFSKLTFPMINKYLPKVLALGIPINMSANFIFNTHKPAANMLGIMGSSCMIGASVAGYLPKAVAVAIPLNMAAQLFFNTNLLTFKSLGLGVTSCVMGGAMIGCAAVYQALDEQPSEERIEKPKKRLVKA